MKFEDIWFPTLDDVFAAHAQAIALHGGSPGVNNQGLLESAINSPKCGYYHSLAEMAAAFAFGIAQNHPFCDGNKRTALLCASSFLAMNGLSIELGSEWEQRMVGVASGHHNRLELTAWFTEAMGGDPEEVE